MNIPTPTPSSTVIITDKISVELSKLSYPYYTTVFNASNGAKVYVSRYADKQDFDDNLQTAKALAESLGIDVKIRPHVDPNILKGYTNPEYEMNNLLGDRKTIASHHSLRKMLDHAKHQMFNTQVNPDRKSYIIAIDITNNKELDIEGIKRELNKKISRGRGSHIHSIIFIKGSRAEELTREAIVDRNYSNLYKIQ